MEPETKVEQIPRIGRQYANRLERLGIETAKDLLFHVPFRYEELGERTLIKNLVVGTKASIAGQVFSIRNLRTKFGKSLTLAKVNDSSGSIEVVWFNQHFLTSSIKTGAQVSLAGKVDFFSSKLSLISPTYELLGGAKTTFHTSGLVPVYAETHGLSSKWLRSRIKEVLPATLNSLKETLPESILAENDLLPLQKSLEYIHFPKSLTQAQKARERFAFEELLKVELKAFKRKKEWQSRKKAPSLQIDQEKVLTLISSLPFSLTGDQNKVLKEIFHDLGSEKPMNRLLQGDVGSGKTIVAALGSYVAFLNGFQSVLMAPTEILAMQHHKTAQLILGKTGMGVGLKTASHKEGGDFDLLIGTHSLIENNVSFDKLGLVVVDEQHRFGVAQRGTLRSKGLSPHFLTMTATPIPRSLALTYFGDLDVSIIEELPAGRQKIKTHLVPVEKRGKAYGFVRQQIDKGRQVFIICPLIEESETLGSVKAATVEFERLKKDIFPDIKMGLLHGRQKSKEKEEVLEKFAANSYKILVSTPVVEVGIDIPNATIMLIEAAERFGLSSLHQLRGRVGRSSHQSYCLLFTQNTGEKALQRLTALEKYDSGLKLSEVDLQMRGPGELYGTLQSGLPEFKFASLADLSLIEKTKAQAKEIFGNFKDPQYQQLITNLEEETAHHD